MNFFDIFIHVNVIFNENYHILIYFTWEDMYIDFFFLLVTYPDIN